MVPLAFQLNTFKINFNKRKEAEGKSESKIY